MIETQASLKQQEVLQKTPKPSKVGVIIDGETPNGLPFTTIQLDDWKEQITPNGEKIEIGHGLILPCSGKWIETQLEKSAEAYTTMRLRLAKYLAPIFATLAGATAIGGCINGIDHENSNDNTSRINPALTMDELSGRTTQYEAAFTQPGDYAPNIGTFNGKTAISFERVGSGMDDSGCFYVLKADILTALQAQNAQKIRLIDTRGNETWGGGCVIHNNQIIYGGMIADLVETADGGLKGENQRELNGFSLDGGEMDIGGSDRTIALADNPDGGIGDPLLLTSVGVGAGSERRLGIHNLNTHIETLRLDSNANCATPHRAPEGGAWVQGFYELFGNDPVVCTIVRAETMDGLRNGWPFLKIYSADGGYTDQRNPRIGSQGVVVFSGQLEKVPRTTPRSLDKPRIYYAIFPYCGDNQCNGNETVESCPSDCLVASTDGGPDGPDGGPDGGADSDGGNGDGGGTELDGSIDGSIIDPDDGGEPDGSVPPDGGGNPANDGGDDHDAGIPEDDGGAPNNDGGAPREDGGAPRPDGGQAPDGGENRPDGGAPWPDGGGNTPDGGSTEPDGSTGGPDGSVNSDDGGADPDAGTTTDAGIQTLDGSMPNGDKDYIGQPPGCSCNTSNSGPSNLASSVLLGIGLIGTKLRRAFKRKK